MRRRFEPLVAWIVEPNRIVVYRQLLPIWEISGVRVT